MLIVVEQKTKKARSINVEEILRRTVNQELEKNFSAEIAKTVTDEIMETVEHPTSVNCIVRCDDRLYSVDLNSMDIKEILLETILPTQTTDFGEDFFAVAIEELKKCMLDFTYGTNINKVIENPRIEETQYGSIELHSLKDINEQKLSSILLEYFSKESERNLMENLEGYLNVENVIANLNTRKGIYYLVAHENDKLTIERPEQFFNNDGLVNMIKPHLRGYVKVLNEICDRIHNYIYYGVTKKIDYRILGGNKKYLIVELEFLGKKAQAIHFLEKGEENNWYIAKPLRITAKRVFEILEENTGYCANLNDSKIIEIKEIMEGLEKDVFLDEKQRDWACFYWRYKKGFNMISGTGETISTGCLDFNHQDDWNEFEKMFTKKFKEPLDSKKFNVYFRIEK